MFALCTIAITNSPSSCAACSSSEKDDPSPSWFCSPFHGLVVVLGMPIMVIVVSGSPSWDLCWKKEFNNECKALKLSSLSSSSQFSLRWTRPPSLPSFGCACIIVYGLCVFWSSLSWSWSPSWDFGVQRSNKECKAPMTQVVVIILVFFSSGHVHLVTFVTFFLLFLHCFLWFVCILVLMSSLWGLASFHGHFGL